MRSWCEYASDTSPRGDTIVRSIFSLREREESRGWCANYRTYRKFMHVAIDEDDEGHETIRSTHDMVVPSTTPCCTDDYGGVRSSADIFAACRRFLMSSSHIIVDVRSDDSYDIAIINVVT